MNQILFQILFQNFRNEIFSRITDLIEIAIYKKFEQMIFIAKNKNIYVMINAKNIYKCICGNN